MPTASLNTSPQARDPLITPRLELCGMTKIFPGVVANDAINLRVMPGEIHAILGENGAGKSTLMTLIYGVIKPDCGQIFWEGKPVKISSPAHARRLGIGMVFQHFSLFETLTVAQNITLALDQKMNLKRLSAKIQEVSELYGLPLKPDRLVHSMTVGERQRVEIVRCLLQAPKLLIMDEPTSVLTLQAIEKLFATLKRLSQEGCSILYISHKLDEIQSICDYATIIRGGQVSGNAVPSRETTSSLAKMMIGKKLPVCECPPYTGQHKDQLVLKGLQRKTTNPFGTNLKNIKLTVQSGEIVGIAGISGNGQKELLKALSGENLCRRPEEIIICGTPCGRKGPSQRRDLGLCFIPEERIGRGAVPGMSLIQNALLTAHRQGMIQNGLILKAKAKKYANRCVDHFGVKCSATKDAINSLSGGNLQKFITGREILQKPKLLVVSQPTWGVDIGAANTIRQAMIDLRSAGGAILVVSEELEELFEICDRIGVIANGQLSPLKRTADTDMAEIGLWMGGPRHLKPA